MVLLGAAILGACAGGEFDTLEVIDRKNKNKILLTHSLLLKLASKTMAGKALIVLPNNAAFFYHQRKYSVFLKMMDDQIAYRTMMA